MKKPGLILIFSLCFGMVAAQQVSTKLAQAFRTFENDAQLRNAVVSLYVVDAATGKVVFDRNSLAGLAPASSQKVITAATAYALLGPGFRYRTDFGLLEYADTISSSGVVRRYTGIVVKPSGDPTLGSWRWPVTSEDQVIRRVMAAARSAGATQIHDIRVFTDTSWDVESVPDGWIWQDLGNYFGAAPHALNWRENQYDVMLESDNAIGSPVRIRGTRPVLSGVSLISYATAAGRGTGDQTNIYFSLDRRLDVRIPLLIRGTIPAGEKNFVVSGSIPFPDIQFTTTLSDSLASAGMRQVISVYAPFPLTYTGREPLQNFHSELSPPLDSINFWFLRKSVNLYGEALVKTFALQQQGIASTQRGTGIVKDFWKDKGIPVTELNMQDGSGLSPENRVTTHALVHVLRYAKTQPWFSSFYHALPEYNRMKMKSGTISGVKSFCGYHRSASGREYVFAFIVNNYNGSHGTLVEKMYRVLDRLK
ncbi:MAG TPA: D-alanyl-D-alanine carboxypeptidase/D-alanyl-D-alanine-endopeptidase [Flavisolibacter sp.]